MIYKRRQGRIREILMGLAHIIFTFAYILSMFWFIAFSTILRINISSFLIAEDFSNYNFIMFSGSVFQIFIIICSLFLFPIMWELIVLGIYSVSWKVKEKKQKEFQKMTSRRGMEGYKGGKWRYNPPYKSRSPMLGAWLK